jgi:HEAT repeat protein
VISDLFELATTGTAAAAPALTQLIADGAASIPVLVAAIERGRKAYAATAILGWLHVADRVSLLAPLLDSAHDGVRRAAIIALGRSGDPRALDMLSPLFVRLPDLLPVIVDAIGELGVATGVDLIDEVITDRVGDPADPEALAALCARASEEHDLGPLSVVSAGAEAIARLGDMRWVSAVLLLSQYADSSEPWQSGLLRADAVRALDVSVGPGVSSALLRCLSDPDEEVVGPAIVAVGHLSRVVPIDHLAGIAATRDDDIGYLAARALEDFVGEIPPIAAETRSWWERNADRFERDRCYVRGELASPRPLVQAIDRSRDRHSRQELRHMAGLSFVVSELTPPPEPELVAIDTWWSAHEYRFTAGSLHRWGRSYPPDACDI